MSDLISRQAAIDAMWKALYAYEDLTEKQFMEHEELELEDWFQHRIFVQRMHEECMKAVESLPSAEPKTGECRTCGRNADNGGIHEDGRTKCPIQEHYALLLDGYCHLYEPYNCGAKMVREDGEDKE